MFTCICSPGLRKWFRPCSGPGSDPGYEVQASLNSGAILSFKFVCVPSSDGSFEETVIPALNLE